MEKVLVVDDEEGMRLTLSALLADEGYDVMTVGDGWEAITSVREASFGLLIMDIMMPGIDGIDTLREIKKIRPTCRAVMMTGFTSQELVEDAKAEGALGVIYKPFDLSALLFYLDPAHATYSPSTI